MIVVGAGPAGSVAAALLARQGAHVTLVEAARFPRDKVCGECLSALGIAVLKQHGLAAAVEGYGPIELTRCRVVDRRGMAADFPLPCAGWGIRRDLMDAALLEAATSAGAELLCPARVVRIDPGASPCVEVRLPEGTIRTLTADVILLADGKSLLPDAEGNIARPTLTGDLGVKAHFQGVRHDPRCIGLFGLRGHYAGLAAVRGATETCWNLAMNVPAARVRGYGGDLEHLFAGLMDENRGLAEAMRDAERVGPWLSCPLPRYGVRRRWPTGIIPIGNAAAAIEPIGGEGMGLAIASAALATAAIEGGRGRQQLERDFARAWRMRRTACRAAAMALSRPMVAGVGVRAVRMAPWLAAVTTGLIGKRRRTVCPHLLMS